MSQADLAIFEVNSDGVNEHIIIQDKCWVVETSKQKQKNNSRCSGSTRLLQHQISKGGGLSRKADGFCILGC